MFSDAGGVTPNNGALRTGGETGNQTVTTCKLSWPPTCPDGCELGLGVQVDTFSVPSSWSRFPLGDGGSGGGDDGEDGGGSGGSGGSDERRLNLESVGKGKANAADREWSVGSGS